MHDQNPPADPGVIPSPVDAGEPEDRGDRPGGGTAREPGAALAELAVRAREIYDHRRRRDALFGDDACVFAEPAWDILLDLFHWQATGRRISLSSSCIASGRPTTTAMRHVEKLVQRALVTRERDPHDARRSWIRLTPRGEALMRECIGGDG